jgi:2-oxoglutarate dehydrogenase E2 component (dihydrolipoamide succinyltransferase)
MSVNITIPSPGESISEVVLGPWMKSSGEWVEKDDPLVEIESDKVTLEVPAPESGVLKVSAEEGAEMSVGDVIGSIDPDAENPSADGEAKKKTEKKKKPSGDDGNGKKKEKVKHEPAAEETAAARNEVATATAAAGGDGQGARATPLAKKLAAERGVRLDQLRGTGPSGRITKSDVLAASGDAVTAEAKEREVDDDRERMPAVAPQTVSVPSDGRGSHRERVSKLRQRVAERLVEAQQTAAMLTTFNEADMTEVMRLRKRHKDDFLEKHGVGLGFMSFFTRACVSALQAFPTVNAYFLGSEIEYHDYCDLSIAVGTPRGLVVPIVRNAEQMSFAQIEAKIKDLATRARDGKLTIEEMTGGTFTISNGGVYGSLMSTPILNPPQAAILGMHKIMNRAVEDPENPGQLVLRPMMYLALSYDHRIVDGEQAVSFLVHVKNVVESPERMLLGL